MLSGVLCPITNYNIEILGAKHSDFDAGSNHQVNLFMRDLSLKANDPNELADFLSSKTKGISVDPKTRIITIDPAIYESPYGNRI